VVNNFRFPGQYYDQETGLHYNYHRYYDPKTGRYLTADPSHSIQPVESGIYFVIPAFLDTPQELNPFSYAQGNPINIIDLLGLYGTTDCSYYDEQCKMVGGDYYCNWAPKWCRRFNRFDSYQWTRCVRQCLQNYDKKYCSPNNSCQKTDEESIKKCNWKGHFFCYSECAKSPNSDPLQR
jgi:RHS repeat-associated protein